MGNYIGLAARGGRVYGDVGDAQPNREEDERGSRRGGLHRPGREGNGSNPEFLVNAFPISGVLVECRLLLFDRGFART